MLNIILKQFRRLKRSEPRTLASGLNKVIIIVSAIGAVVFSPIFDVYAFSLNEVKELPKKAFLRDVEVAVNTPKDFVKEPNKTSIIVGDSAFFVQPVPPRQLQQVVVASSRVPISAYSSTPDQTDSTPFITASGTRTRDGVVAANYLPIGTKIKIPAHFGDKIFTVEDRMNRRYYRKVDVWMPTRGEALQFGVRYAEVEIVEEI